MNGGDPILGGGQANPNPGNTQSTPPGPQPAPSATPTTTPSQAPTPIPQVPQSPVNTAPIPANTTQSPDSFSSFSTQPSRPIAPPHMATYGNSFSRPTVGRPSFPAPHPIDQPINPIAPNGIINGSQMPSSTFPSSDQVVFSDTGATSATSSGKGKKIAIIALLLLLVAGSVIAALFATGILGGNQSTNTSSQSGGVSSTKEEVYSALWDFDNTYYASLIEAYELNIGLTPHFKMSSTNILFPAESYADILSEKTNEAVAAYEDILPKLPDQVDNIDLSEVKASINNSLQAIKQNSDLIYQVYDAYIAPLGNEPRPSTCEKTPAMLSLEQGDIAAIATKYYVVYCDALNYANNTADAFFEPAVSELQQMIAIPSSEAATALNDHLVEVTSATASINKLFEELTK